MPGRRMLIAGVKPDAWRVFEHGLSRVAEMLIRLKLFVILLLTTLALVGGMYGFMRWSLEDGFSRFVEKRQDERIENFVEALRDCYIRHEGWQLLREDRRHWLELLWYANHKQEPPPDFMMLAVQDDPGWPPKQLPGYGYGSNPGHFELRVMLLDAERRPILARSELVEKADLRPIELDDRTLGFLALLPGKPLAQPLELQYFDQQSRAFILVGLIMVLLSAGLASALAYWLGKPLNSIAGVVRQLAAGNYQPRLAVQSRDELGRLAADINQLAQTLEQTEQSRRQWVADISHELRTPLSILRAELEALQDGIRPLHPEAVDLLLNDVLRLNRLTDDLYQLALSDQNALTYRCSHVEPLGLLSTLLQTLKADFAQKTIRLEQARPWPNRAWVLADPDRLTQLFRNLLTNSLNYTDAGGCLKIGGRLESGRLWIEFADSAPAVSNQDFARIFERFYRVEGSRSRNHGGAGLGLALCQTIVEAHGGSICAGPSDLGGLKISVGLPLVQSHHY